MKTQEITWELFDRQVEECRLCGLCRNIRHKVPGQGDRCAPLMLIGEGPGQTEDEEGLAFVGAAGQLLTRMLQAIHLPRNRSRSAMWSSAARRTTGFRPRKRRKPAGFT